MNTMLDLIFFIYTLERSLTILYFLQIKEYRRDRVYSALKEEGFFSHLYGSAPHFPAKTARNLLMTITITICAFCLTWLFSSLIWYGKFTLLLLVPCLSFAFAALGVWLTAPYAYLKKRRIMNLAAHRLRMTKTQVIGITGSYGKSTTKEWLFELIRDTYQTVRTKENQNTAYGIADNILQQITPQTRFLIAEIGAYREGEIREVCDVIHPTYGIVTPLGNQHLSLFGSPEKLARAKKELIDALPEKGIAYVNKRDVGLLSIKTLTTIRTYSLDQHADVTLSPSTSNTYVLTYAGKTIPFYSVLPLPYLTNLLPATALALDLKVPPELIQSKLNQLTLPHNRLVMQKGSKGHTLITDIYSSNVEGFMAAILFLSQQNAPKKIIVSRGIIELGQQKETSYEKIAKEISRSPCTVYTTDKAFAKSLEKPKVVLFANERLLAIGLKNVASPDTAILLEGRFPESFVKKIL